MKDLYPLNDAYSTELLDVGSGHHIYVEQSGNPKGQPLIYFHGGPGGNCKPQNRQFFDPAKYRVIIFDQRGCGKSTFTELLKDNTTQDLIADAEKIREHFGIEKWHVFGGSWGSTLALKYAEDHPDKVKSLIVRGIYFGTKPESNWGFGGGAEKFFPDTYQPLLDFMTAQGLSVSPENLSKLVLGNDPELAYQAAKLSDDWESAIISLIPYSRDNGYLEDPSKEVMLNSKKIMFHYTDNDCFLEDNELINNSDKLREIPTVIIQGRYDLVCPFETAWKLHLALPSAEFKIIPTGGHYHSDPETINALIEATDKFAKL